MEFAWVIILIVWAIISRAAKKQQREKTGASRVTRQAAAPNRAARQQTVQRAPANAGIPHKQPEKKAAPAVKTVNEKAAFAEGDEAMPFTESGEGFAHREEKEGSIALPPREAHEHEGKPLPCPADEREAPRPRPAQQALTASVPAAQPALQLSFSQSSVLNAVIMSEVLKRPEFKNGRRVIH